MPIYKIRIDKPGKKAAHHAIIESPSIADAEYYAISEMLLKPRKVAIEDHFKVGADVRLRSKSRGDHKSLFKFGSELLGKELPQSDVSIIRDNDAKAKIFYRSSMSETIFQLFRIRDEELPELPFFNQQDLDYFASVIGTQFESGDESIEVIKQELKENGVYAKTSYWASLLRLRGYITEFKFSWQMSGVIRRYTWARVFLPDLYNENVFFTVGVGSRPFDDDTGELYLVYKLDCRRKKLSKEKIALFDNYTSEYWPGFRKQIIKGNELGALNWTSLTDITTTFIERYAVQYRELVSLLNDSSGYSKKLSRLCWNERGWERPSGPVGKSKSTANAFEKEKGYGYEEWLFDTSKQIDGYHYSFLQSLNKGDHEGKIYEMDLYSFKEEGEREQQKFWVGRIKELEVLTKEEAKGIVQVYKERGWYDEMLFQLKEFNIPGFDFGPVKENEIFNLRYKVESSNWLRYSPFPVVKDFKREIRSNHYVLLDKLTNDVDGITSGVYQFEEGHNPQSKTGKIQAGFTASFYTKELLHKEMQEHIYLQLTRGGNEVKIIAGTEIKTGYGTLIDLVVRDPNEGDVFYEVKTGSSAVGCIREALGQLIEYSYYPKKKLACRMIIVSPHKADFQVRQYMSHLRSQLGIEIYYQQYLRDLKRLDVDII